MRLKDRLSPYPILFDYRDDYIKSSFSAEIEAEEIFHELCLSVRFTLNDEVLSRLIIDGKAEFLIHVESSPVSARNIYTTVEEAYTLKLNTTQIKDRVEVCTFIVAKANLNYSNPNFHSDYEGMSFELNKGQLLAIGTAKKFTITKTNDDIEKLPSIFKIRKLRDAKKGTMSVNTDDNDYIFICLTEDVINKYVLLGKHQFKQSVFSLVLLPALVIVLARMRENDDSIRDNNWYQHLESLLNKSNYKVEDLDIYDSSGSILAIAQAIFADPIKRCLDELESTYVEE